MDGMPTQTENTLRSCYPNDTEREGPNPLCDPCSTVHTLCRSSVGKHASLRAAGNALQVSCVSQAYYAATRRSKATAPERLSQAILAMPPRSAAGQRNPNKGKQDGTLSLHRFFSKGGSASLSPSAPGASLSPPEDCSASLSPALEGCKPSLSPSAAGAPVSGETFPGAPASSSEVDPLRGAPATSSRVEVSLWASPEVSISSLPEDFRSMDRGLLDLPDEIGSASSPEGDNKHGDETSPVGDGIHTAGRNDCQGGEDVLVIGGEEDDSRVDPAPHHGGQRRESASSIGGDQCEDTPDPEALDKLRK